MIRAIAWSLMTVAALLAIHAAYLPIKAALAQYLIAQSWQHYQQTGKPMKPWRWADTHPIASLSFIRLEKSLVVLNAGDPTSLAFSVGAIAPFNQANSSSPFVVAGHRDSHFSFLSEVSMEDIISVADSTGRHQLYIVKSIEVVNANEQPHLAVEEESLVLITCYPFNALSSNSQQRYIVKAQLLT